MCRRYDYKHNFQGRGLVEGYILFVKEMFVEYKADYPEF